MAIFKKGKLARWLNNDKAHAASWVQNKIDKTVVTLPCKKHDGVTAVEVLRSKTHLQPSVTGNKVKMTVDIRAEGNLQELACPLNIKDPEVVRKLEKQLSARLRKNTMAVIQTAQKNRTDIFGFGEAIERADPRDWKSLQKRWPKTFSDMAVNVQVKFFIRRSGLRTNPLVQKK